MEELCEDISKNDTLDQLSPEWHFDTLDKREKRVQNGEAKLYSLEEVKEEYKKLK